jgi:two-component system, NarL family, sensor histidine kinase DesK
LNIKEEVSLMKKWLTTIQDSTGISPYIWSIFIILPFYFIFQLSSTFLIVAGILLTIFFYAIYRLAYGSKGWPVYLWTCLLILISCTMTSFFGYVYFAFFLAYFIGNLTNRIAFMTFYIVHLVSLLGTINYHLVLQNEQFLKQLPFVIIIIISSIFLPISIYNRKKHGQLEEQLAFANKRISDLIVQEERQRIARDLHDTLGQKLSLIGLKSDLAGKILIKDPEQARVELKDIQRTARTALNEVRNMVSQMRGIRLKEELVHVKQLLDAAGVQLIQNQKTPLANVSLFVENILSMCLKEAVTNVVKHSGASLCRIEITQTKDEIVISVSDNGKGIVVEEGNVKGNGLLGMRERLEFVNGNLEISSDNGTTIKVKVPNVVKQLEKEVLS